MIPEFILTLLGETMSPRAALHFTLPDGESHTVPLSPNDPVMIGRSRESTVKLNFPSVSRKHARIFFERDIYWIEDLKSSNGTFVNQKQVRKARVNIGDVLKCGDFVLRVLSDDAHLEPHEAGGDHAELSLQEQVVEIATPHIQDHPAEIRKQLQSQSRPPVWASRAPTLNPDRSELTSQGISVVSSASAAPIVKTDSLIPPPVDLSAAHNPKSEIRRQNLSTAYSDNQLDQQVDQGPAHPPHHSQGPHQIQTAQPEDLSAELRRTRINERQLLDEVNHLNQNIETLQAQLQESRERVAELERELDIQAKQHSEHRLNQDQLLEETQTRYSEQAHQSAALAEDNHNLKKEIGLLHNRLSAQQELTHRTQQDLERIQQQVVHNQQQSHEAAVDSSATSDQESSSAQQVAELLDENQRLRQEAERREELIKTLNARSTPAHVFSLPQPNLEATHPDWAQHQARLDHIISEMRHLRVHNRELQKINEELRASSVTPALAESGSQHHVPVSLISPTAPEVVVLPNKDISGDDQGLSSQSEESEESPSWRTSQEISSAPTTESDHQSIAQSSSTASSQRRAWRGMFS